MQADLGRTHDRKEERAGGRGPAHVTRCFYTCGGPAAGAPGCAGGGEAMQGGGRRGRGQGSGRSARHASVSRLGRKSEVSPYRLAARAARADAAYEMRRRAALGPSRRHGRGRRHRRQFIESEWTEEEGRGIGIVSHGRGEGGKARLIGVSREDVRAGRSVTARVAHGGS